MGDDDDDYSEFGSEVGGVGCSLMRPTLTTSAGEGGGLGNGLCYSFNAPPPEELLRDSPFRRAFLDAFAPELEREEGESPAVVMGFDGGDGGGLLMYLDRQRMVLQPEFEVFEDGAVEAGEYYVSINNLVCSFFFVDVVATKVRYTYSFPV